jgi:hypothetical protein
VSRGAILKLTPTDVVARALSLCLVPEDRQARIWYSAERGRNGGSDPTANTCASIWRDPADGRIWCTSDCVGLGLWAYGMDRYQPPLWLNQNSLYAEAKAGRGGWRFCNPYPGCLALILDDKRLDGSRRPGHVGVVTRQVAGVWYAVHCSPSNHKRAGQGIAETTVRVAMGARSVHYVDRVG